MKSTDKNTTGPNNQEGIDWKEHARQMLGLSSKEAEAPSQENTAETNQTSRGTSSGRGRGTVDWKVRSSKRSTRIPVNEADPLSRTGEVLALKHVSAKEEGGEEEEDNNGTELEMGTGRSLASCEQEECSERQVRPGAYRVGHHDDEGSSGDDIYEEQEAHSPSPREDDGVYVVCATAVDEEGENSRRKRLQELEMMVQGLPAQKRRLLVVGSIMFMIVIAAIVISVSVTNNKDKGREQIFVTVPPSQFKTTSPTPEGASTSPPSPVPIPVLQKQTHLESWGIDRIDQEELPLDDTYYYRYTGKGVIAFIISTGILASHTEFHGDRASCGFDLIENGTCEDLDGWGTMLAAVVGGSSYGVAKEADIVSVRAFNTSDTGSVTAVVNGIGYIKQQKDNNPSQPMVALLPFGVEFRPIINAAVQSLIRSGVVAVVAGSGCNDSPASLPEAITVGASTQDDMLADFTGTGPCIDIFAPGVNISTAWNTGTVSWAREAAGTSYAAAHVAGVAALYLEAHPDWTPAQVWEAMEGDAVPGVLTDVSSDSPNLLVTTARLND